mmetsp:Transcript_23443/g.45755  ORF Transcript_23443/g.45755 Transcript_23443/m.45755 type:complete len:234 (+) Transcript_23443:360-1061(+)
MILSAIFGSSQSRFDADFSNRRADTESIEVILIILELLQNVPTLYKAVPQLPGCHEGSWCDKRGPFSGEESIDQMVISPSIPIEPPPPHSLLPVAQRVHLGPTLDILCAHQDPGRGPDFRGVTRGPLDVEMEKPGRARGVRERFGEATAEGWHRGLGAPFRGLEHDTNEGLSGAGAFSGGQHNGHTLPSRMICCFQGDSCEGRHKGLAPAILVDMLLVALVAPGEERVLPQWP